MLLEETALRVNLKNSLIAFKAQTCLTVLPSHISLQAYLLLKRVDGWVVTQGDDTARIKMKIENTKQAQKRSASEMCSLYHQIGLSL